LNDNPAPDAAPLIVEMIRGRTVESRHRVHVAVVDPGGRLAQFAGDGLGRVYPRSALKPFQAAAMVDAGLELPDPRLLAIAASSHSGEPMHVQAVRRLLGSVGLTESDLGNVAAWPSDDAARTAWIAGGGKPTRVRMNCSGKHAAMLATCVSAGWPLANYLSPDHPLQVWLRDWIDHLLGVDTLANPTTDGCGAPIWTIPLPVLAGAFTAIWASDPGSAGGRVSAAMRSHPELVGGSHRDVTTLMRRVPGLLAKDGAEGICAAALPDGRGLAIKVEDGAGRARPAAMAWVLTQLGVPAPAVPELRIWEPVLGGGRVVGEFLVTGQLQRLPGG
jgi:L-asparaginase II